MRPICYNYSGNRQLDQVFRLVLLVLVALVGVCIPQTGWGQAGSPQAQRILDEPFRMRMDEQVPVAKRVIFDWGGWFRSFSWVGS